MVFLLGWRYEGFMSSKEQLLGRLSKWICKPCTKGSGVAKKNQAGKAEEAIGSGHDFRKAQSEGLFGRGASPFLGYFIFIEDAPGSRSPVSTASPHFPADISFQGASYQARMRILCERMVESQLYSAAAVLAASSDGDGAFQNLSGPTSVKSMLARLAGYLSGESSAAAGDSALVREDAPQETLGFLTGNFFNSLDEGEGE